jgi:hypothetical protein
MTRHHNRPPAPTNAAWVVWIRDCAVLLALLSVAFIVLGTQASRAGEVFTVEIFGQNLQTIEGCRFLWEDPSYKPKNYTGKYFAYHCYAPIRHLRPGSEKGYYPVTLDPSGRLKADVTKQWQHDDNGSHQASVYLCFNEPLNDLLKKQLGLLTISLRESNAEIGTAKIDNPKISWNVAHAVLHSKAPGEVRVILYLQRSFKPEVAEKIEPSEEYLHIPLKNYEPSKGDSLLVRATTNEGKVYRVVGAQKLKSSAPGTEYEISINVYSTVTPTGSEKTSKSLQLSEIDTPGGAIKRTKLDLKALKSLTIYLGQYSRDKRAFRGYKTELDLKEDQLSYDVNLKNERVVKPEVTIIGPNKGLPDGGLQAELCVIQKNAWNHPQKWTPKKSINISGSVTEKYILDEIETGDIVGLGLRLNNWEAFSSFRDSTFNSSLTFDIDEYYRILPIQFKESLYDSAITLEDPVNYMTQGYVSNGQTLCMTFLGEASLKEPGFLKIAERGYDKKVYTWKKQGQEAVFTLIAQPAHYILQVVQEAITGPPDTTGEITFNHRQPTKDRSAYVAETVRYQGKHGDTLSLPFGTQITGVTMDIGLKKDYDQPEVGGLEPAKGPNQYIWNAVNDTVFVMLKGKTRGISLPYTIEPELAESAEPEFLQCSLIRSDGEVITAKTQIQQAGKKRGALRLENATTTTCALNLVIKDQLHFEDLTLEGFSLTNGDTLKLMRRQPGVVILLDASQNMSDVREVVIEGLIKACADLKTRLPQKLAVDVVQEKYYDSIPDLTETGIQDFLDAHPCEGQPEPSFSLPRALNRTRVYNQGIKSIKNRILYIIPSDPQLREPWDPSKFPFTRDAVDLFVIEVGRPNKIKNAISEGFFAKELERAHYWFVTEARELEEAIKEYAQRDEKKF